MKKEQLICIGNGMSCLRTVEELLKIDPDKYDITIFGEEPHCNYNRIQLSPVLAGDSDIADIMLHEREWYVENGIQLYTSDPIVKIDRIKRHVISESGLCLDYDKLLLATGSMPFIPPIPGTQLNGVVTFRNIADVQNMLSACHDGKQHAVVIGGGLLGLEAANGLSKQGMQVTVVHLADALMNRQLDKPAAALLQTELQQRGLNFILDVATEKFLGDANDNVTSISFRDGQEIPAELVVIAAGIRPNVTLAKDAGLYCKQGIVVNDTMQTYDPRIYAVGECVEHREQVYGLVAPLYEQARVCANHLAGWGYSAYPGSVNATTLKVAGIDLFSAGEFEESEHSEVITFRDPLSPVYKKLVIDRDRLQGVVLYGDTSDSGWYLQLMKDASDIGALRQQLAFGKPN